MTTNSDRRLSPILAWAFALAGVGFVLGAFGAHALANVISVKSLETFKTGQLYHMFASFGLIALGVMHTLTGAPRWVLGAKLMGVGLLIFSGSLYLLALTGVRWLGAITPIGGVFMITSWTLAAWWTLQGSRQAQSAE